MSFRLLYIPTIIYLLFAYSATAQDKYKYTIDLTNVVDDKVKVTLQCPELKEEKAIFVMPRVIPGSYSYKEYGRFITDIKAFDSLGLPIKISKKKNIFYIKSGAYKLRKLEYWVNDTWDDKDKKNFIFQPGGSNIEGNNNFVVNHHAFEGYFEGYKNLNFEVEIIKPAFFFGNTWLKKDIISKNKDVLYAKTYNELVDNPIMYCIPDTSSFNIDQTRIVISSFSDQGIHRADSLKEWLKPLANSLKNFMGKLPVDEYHFIYYFASEGTVSKMVKSGFGALEHHHSSFYFLPETSNDKHMKKMVQDVGAHEFLHTITPLNLHSYEIADFDFKEPKMSQHLWLYEGVTEYFSWLVRLQNELVSEEEFIKEMSEKLKRADTYGFYSLTLMSKHVLTPFGQQKYVDIYQRGAIAAMTLDLLLLKESSGKYGLKHLINDLIQKYGPDRPFEDELLFAEIEKLTYPKIKEFIDKCLKGGEPFPLTNAISDFGYEYIPSQKLKVYNIGNFSLGVTEDNQIQVKLVGLCYIDLKPKDIIKEINGFQLTPENFFEMADKYFRYNTSPSAIKLKIIRNGEETIISGLPWPSNSHKPHVFIKKENVSSRTFHDAWLKGKYQ